ncbi:hypothetical protein BHM03_00056429 [Ensete ventricosum]|nr:hypothetical protein BHM03_00056429 [Ensete ventricosum]
MESTVRSIPQFDVLLSSIRPASDRKALSCAPAAAPAAAQPKKRVNPKKLRTATGPGSCELNPPRPLPRPSPPPSPKRKRER